MTRTRIEADREDLMAEAVNLRERIELKVPGIDTPVTIGCNGQGHWSFYFGAEPMYRFDTEGRLRRAVRDGRLYRTQGATLAELERVRLDDETELRRRDLGPDEIKQFLELVGTDLGRLWTPWDVGQCEVLRETGTGPDFQERLNRLLKHLTTTEMTLAPAMPTKRQ